MADRIESISGISYNSSKIEPIRNYTTKERKAKLKQIQKNIQEYQSYLADERFVKEKYSNPAGLSFKELLEQDETSVKPLEDDDGFELDIKS